MSMEDRTFLRIDGLNKLGEFKANYSPLIKEKSILFPVFFIEKKIEKSLKWFKLLPGYLDNNDVFFHCPLVASFIQINSIIQEENYKLGFRICNLYLDIDLYNKELSTRINKVISLEKQSGVTDFMKFNSMINLLNRYIFSGRKIEKIDYNKFSELWRGSKSREELIRIIDDLEFEFYEDGINRVGKDSICWNEKEIRKLPTDHYIYKLLIEILSESFSVEEKKGFILVQTRAMAQFEPSFGRRKLADQYDTKIKLDLKIDLVNKYDKDEHILDFIKKSN